MRLRNKIFILASLLIVIIVIFIFRGKKEYNNYFLTYSSDQSVYININGCYLLKTSEGASIYFNINYYLKDGVNSINISKNHEDKKLEIIKNEIPLTPVKIYQNKNSSISYEYELNENYQWSWQKSIVPNPLSKDDLKQINDLYSKFIQVVENKDKDGFLKLKEISTLDIKKYNTNVYNQLLESGNRFFALLSRVNEIKSMPFKDCELTVLRHVVVLHSPQKYIISFTDPDIASRSDMKDMKMELGFDQLYFVKIDGKWFIY